MIASLEGVGAMESVGREIERSDERAAQPMLISDDKFIVMCRNVVRQVIPSPITATRVNGSRRILQQMKYPYSTASLGDLGV